MSIINYKEYHPKIASNCFIAPDSWVIGDITIGEGSSVFFGSSLRGDILPIKIGEKTNMQEQCIIHTSRGKNAVKIGNGVTIGHRALIHGCQIENYSLIGMGSTILDDAQIGSNCIIGAHALVTQNAKIPPGTLTMGVPAKVVRDLSEEEIQGIINSAQNYYEVGQYYLKHFATCPK